MHGGSPHMRDSQSVAQGMGKISFLEKGAVRPRVSSEAAVRFIRASREPDIAVWRSLMDHDNRARRLVDIRSTPDASEHLGHAEER